MSQLEALFEQSHLRNSILVYLDSITKNGNPNPFLPTWPEDPSELCKYFSVAALRCTSRRLSKLPHPVCFYIEKPIYQPNGWYPSSPVSRDTWRMGYSPCPSDILNLKHTLCDYLYRMNLDDPLNMNHGSFQHHGETLTKVFIYSGFPITFQILHDGVARPSIQSRD